MWATLLKMILADKNVRENLVAIVGGALFLILAILYALLASPWANLTGQFNKIFADPDKTYEEVVDATYFDDGEYSMLTEDKYVANFQQYHDNFESTLNPPYKNEWGATHEDGHEFADELAEAKAEEYEELEDACTVTWKGHSVTYSTFGSEFMYGGGGDPANCGASENCVCKDDEGNHVPCDPDNPDPECAVCFPAKTELGETLYAERLTQAAAGIHCDDCADGFDRIRINDASITLAAYDIVGLHWKCYAGLHEADCDEHIALSSEDVTGMKNLLKEMGVKEEEMEGSLVTTDCTELVTLLKKNAHKFFQGHVPDASGLCFPNTRPIYLKLRWDDTVDELPRSWNDLKTKTYLADDGEMKKFEEPYGGIYWAVKKEECDCNSDDDEDNDHAFTHYDYTIHYTVVSYVEYKGYGFLEDYLYVSRFPKGGNYIDETYRNLCDLVGQQAVNNTKLSNYSLGLDPLFKEDTKERDELAETGARESYFFGNGGTTLRPVDADVSRVTAYFKDPNYIKDLTHWGIDFGAAAGTPIKATSDGEVVKVGWDHDGFGNYVVLYQGKNEATGDRYYCIYAHMLERPSVGEGQSVGAGEQIGKVGSTGFSTGPHLHYEVRVVRADGTTVSIDPLSAESGLVL